MSASQDAGALLLCALTVLFTLRHGEGGDDRRVVKGEHHHRNRQPESHPQTITGKGRAVQGEGFQRRAVPLRNQVQCEDHQSDNEREHQNTHRFNNHLLAETHDGHHAHNQNQRQDRPRRRGHLQLVGHKAFDGIGDSHAINQQNRVDGEEVEQGNQLTCADTEVLFYHFRDVFTRIFTGKDKTGHSAVGEKGHRESKNCHDDQGDHTADAGINRQEQYARADCRTVQSQHPHGICFAPSATGFTRYDSAGLSGFHLYLLEEATKYND
ncbi:Uncharacterised protein [Raoultella ornithinolytica]|nr:Uncharacterised protein [Raoultella ornithinolytica]